MMGMIHAGEFLDYASLGKLVAEGWITRREHPRAPGLWIYNYTARCAYSDFWTPETLACRGLILDHCGGVVARPFAKFFNLSQHLPESSPLPRLPIGDPFEAWEKLDGSLGIAYLNPESDRIEIATRGSFDSEQARWATKFRQERCSDLNIPPGQTWLFEIIYPENRIVVDYKGMQALVLLAVIDTATGQDLSMPSALSLPMAKRYDADSVESLIESAKGQDMEGFVLRYPSTGQRVKVKLDEYVRLHRLLTGCNARTIWEALSSGQSLEPVLDRVPDEFYAWVRQEEYRQRTLFREIEIQALNFFASSGARSVTRKDAAEMFKAQPHTAVLFRMLDGKDYAPLIWKAIYPEHTRPFAVDEP